RTQQLERREADRSDGHARHELLGNDRWRDRRSADGRSEWLDVGASGTEASRELGSRRRRRLFGGEIACTTPGGRRESSAWLLSRRAVWRSSGRRRRDAVRVTPVEDDVQRRQDDEGERGG